MTLRNYIQILRGRERKKACWACECFLPKSRYHSIYFIENYSNFKSNFSFNNGSILEIHDHFRTMGKFGFNDLPQLINALSNQDFAGLNNLD